MMKVSFLNENVSITTLSFDKFLDLPINKAVKSYVGAFLKRPIVQKDLESYYAKITKFMQKPTPRRGKVPDRLKSVFLSDGKPGLLAFLDFGILYCHSGFGLNPKCSYPIARNEIRFDPYADLSVVPMHFLLDEVPDLSDNTAKLEANKARSIVKKLSHYSDYDKFREALRKEAASCRFSW